MKINRKKFLVSLSISVAVCVSAYFVFMKMDGDELPKEQKLVSAIAESISSDRISKIEIFYVPFAVETFRAVTPEALFSNSPALVVYKGSPEIELIRKALKNTRVLPNEGDSDVRVGFVAFDASGVKVLSFAISPLNGGYVNGTSCYLKGNMKKVLARLSSPPTEMGFKEKVYNFILLNR